MIVAADALRVSYRTGAENDIVKAAKAVHDVSEFLDLWEEEGELSAEEIAGGGEVAICIKIDELLY